MPFYNLKKFGLALAIFAGAALNAMADGGLALVVTTKSSDKVVYALSEKPVVTFTATDVVLTTAKVTVSYPLADHVGFTFADVATDVVTPIEGLSATIACDGRTVSVDNAQPGTRMSLYTADGKLLGATTVDANGQASLGLRPQTLHIVKLGTMTVKIQN